MISCNMVKKTTKNTKKKTWYYHSIVKHPEIQIPSSLLNFVIPNLFLPSKIKEKNVSTVFVYKMKVSGSKTTQNPNTVTFSV